MLDISMLLFAQNLFYLHRLPLVLNLDHREQIAPHQNEGLDPPYITTYPKLYSYIHVHAIIQSELCRCKIRCNSSLASHHHSSVIKSVIKN